jgi:hypothetical protein
MGKALRESISGSACLTVTGEVMAQRFRHRRRHARRDVLLVTVRPVMGLTDRETATLATYRVEREHGFVHTRACRAQMADLEQRHRDAVETFRASPTGRALVEFDRALQPIVYGIAQALADGARQLAEHMRHAGVVR